MSKGLEFVLNECENKFGTSDELGNPSSDRIAMEKEHIPQCQQVDWHFAINIPEPEVMGKINGVEDSPRLLSDVLIAKQVSDTLEQTPLSPFSGVKRSHRHSRSERC